MEIYKRLLTYLRPYKGRLCWSVVFMGLTSALDVGAGLPGKAGTGQGHSR